MLIGFSGKKQSGKGTCYKFIESVTNRPCEEFSFAYKLKQMCVEILGLRHEQAFGTDAEKNTPVPHLLWENFPLRTWVNHAGAIRIFRGEEDAWSLIGWKRKVGPMTGREVLQYWGSEIFRRQYPNVWADALVRMTNAWLKDHPDGVAVVTDVRFPNEVDAVHRVDGKVVRLTRNPFDDQHMSETVLDEWTNFDLILDNRFMNVGETGGSLLPALMDWGFVP